MTLLLIGVGIMLLGGVSALLASGSPRLPVALGIGGVAGGAILGLIPTLRVLLGGQTDSLQHAWSVPYGAFSVELDPLSAFFLLPILTVSLLAAIYGGEYLGGLRGARCLGAHHFFFNLLVASMVMVVLARNGVLFLVCWELMSLASFFLVTFEDENESARAAGWTYLVATHIGTAFLLALFVLLGHGGAGALDFAEMAARGQAGLVDGAGLLFALAVVGFGTKAGFMPLHIWLPEAHPAAPSHVSAVMSGVMIKTGIYGLLRVLTFLGAPAPWWGWLLLAIGASSGILGVLFALAQHDLKRLLAYHSVENIGIIALGLGVGLIGMSYGSLPLLVLGFGGGLLHVLNHALFKGLLFLGAGAVLHSTGTREIDHLGGLLKRMPWTGVAFLIGAVAISGLPPLNGFISELLIYLGAYRGATEPRSLAGLAVLAVIPALALIGGHATACFTKAFGIVFLGEPRGSAAARAHETGLAMRVPLVVLATGCVAVGFCAPWTIGVLGGVVAAVSGRPAGELAAELAFASEALSTVVVVSVGFAALVALLAVGRSRLLAGRQVSESVTWDCGYASPSARMQYTASSFAQPLTLLFDKVLRTRRHFAPPRGLFPLSRSTFHTATPDVFQEHVYAPGFAAIDRTLGRLRWLQHGRVQLYVLYIAVTILVLLVWKLG
ncbi:MAG: hypothetical protein HYV63_24125 [Candidatus Schekmanbacteria bacterium]|nr:hypothetical protein [Candidatus Schekmanbacteria bacterium]